MKDDWHTDLPATVCNALLCWEWKMVLKLISTTRFPGKFFVCSNDAKSNLGCQHLIPWSWVQSKQTSWVRETKGVQTIRYLPSPSNTFFRRLSNRRYIFPSFCRIQISCRVLHCLIRWCPHKSMRGVIPSHSIQCVPICDRGSPSWIALLRFRRVGACWTKCFGVSITCPRWDFRGPCEWCLSLLLRDAR